MNDMNDKEQENKNESNLLNWLGHRTICAGAGVRTPDISLIHL
jgi:hypothetical protein